MKRLLHALVAATITSCALYGAGSLALRTVPRAAIERVVFPSLLDLFFAPVEATYAPTPIKSIQRGTISLTTADFSVNATITAVIANNAYVEFGGFSGDGGRDATSGLRMGTVLLKLTNGTTVNALRNSTGVTDTVSVPWQVIEYRAGILKQAVQRGVVSINPGGTSATSATATITSVTTTKAILVYCGYNSNEAGGWNGAAQSRWWPWLELTNATTVTGNIKSNAVNQQIDLPYQVVESK